MKKIKIIVLLLLVSISTNNANALMSKKTADNISFWTMVFAALDLVPNKYKDTLLPANRNYNLGADFKLSLLDPNLKIEIPKKLKLLQFNINDSHISINPLILIHNILDSSLEKNSFWDENLLSSIISFFIRTEGLSLEIEQNLKQLSLDELLLFSELLKIEPEVFLAEKVSELVVAKTLDATLKNQKILKRLSRVILLTAISAGGAYLRSVLAKEFATKNFEQALPKVPTVVVNKLVENLITEFFAELLQRYIIEDPERQKLEEKKKKFQQKLEEIIAATNNNKNSDNKSDKEKKSFVIAPA